MLHEWCPTCQGHHSELIASTLVSTAIRPQIASPPLCLRKDCKIGGAFQNCKYVVRTCPIMVRGKNEGAKLWISYTVGRKTTHRHMQSLATVHYHKSMMPSREDQSRFNSPFPFSWVSYVSSKLSWTSASSSSSQIIKFFPLLVILIFSFFLHSLLIFLCLLLLRPERSTFHHRGLFFYLLPFLSFPLKEFVQ